MIKLNEEEICIEGCVYRVWYGSKYIIVKAQTLYGSVTTINTDYEKFLRLKIKDFFGRNPHYFKFFSYLKSHPGHKTKVEVLLETNNGYQLLKREEQELEKAFPDPNCLNNNIFAYVPKKRADGMYGWIKPAWVLNYKRFLKR